MKALQQALPFDLIVVRCFLSECPHVVEHSDPDAAHAAMEEHYDTTHAHYIRRLIQEEL